MLIVDAQRNMRYAYFGGGPRVLASAWVWLSAGLAALINSADASIMTLFIGGIFIHPAGLLMAKVMHRPGAHDSGNPPGMRVYAGVRRLFAGDVSCAISGRHVHGCCD